MDNLTYQGRPFVDEGQDAYPYLVSRTTVLTTISLPDFPWSLEHKISNKLLTCDINFKQTNFVYFFFIQGPIKEGVDGVEVGDRGTPG